MNVFQYGWSPMYLAALEENEAAIEKLREYGAIVNNVNEVSVVFVSSIGIE